MENVKELQELLTLGCVPDDVCGLVVGLLKANGKGDLMRLVYTPEEYKKVDSAYPQGLADRMRELNPAFRGWFMVFDYNKATYGQMENVAEMLVEKILNKL